MIKEFRLPDLGEGLTESELIAWRVAEGETVGLDQIIAEVETAKAMVELPSPHAGVVERLYVPPGSTVSVGEPIIAFRVDGPGPEGGDAAPPNLVGYGAGPAAAGRPARRPRRLGAAVVEPEASAVPAEPPQRIAAPPPVRRLADRLGVRLEDVAGTGEHGLVTREDVERAASGRPAEAGTETGQERVPVRGVRRRTAEAMVASAFTAPHVTMFLTVDATATLELIERLKSRPDHRDVRLTVLAAVARAVCLAVPRHPEINSRWAGEEIVLSRTVNLGIAVATPRGLLVPNVKDAGGLELAGLAVRLGELTATAREGRSTPADLSGGTITISNVGVFGVDAGTPILNNGEAAILAVGAVASRPWEWQGGIALRSVVTLSLSIDHRVLDGEQGALFLADVGRILTDPATVFAG
jgi:pyruvate dehydrogenase E2 component (dihydrolipoamide acetyltransferase)